MDGFKPCPACGENALVRRYEDGCCFIVCLSCNMRGPGESNMIAAKYAWNELPRALTWTKETPTVSGVYWLKNPNSDAEEIVLLDGLSVYYMMTEWFESLSELPDGCEWAGPLTLPKEVG